tara:strand:+ start:47 stop:169 length:123 start_codon:yes stop_codon:yes gene_type:complete
MKKVLITTVQFGDKKLHPLKMEEAVHFLSCKPLEGLVPEH